MNFRGFTLVSAAWLGLAVACGGGGDDDDAPDSGAATDGAVAIDSATTTTDGAPADARIVDAEITADGGGCHPNGFGAPAAAIRVVSSLPAATGGVIPTGTYDVVDAQTTGTLTGSIRSTWVFESTTTVHVFEQITLTGTPPVPTPRTFAVTTSSNRVMRNQTCPVGTSTFDNEYSVRTVGTDTFLDLKQNTLMFTFKKR